MCTDSAVHIGCGSRCYMRMLGRASERDEESLMVFLDEGKQASSGLKYFLKRLCGYFLSAITCCRSIHRVYIKLFSQGRKEANYTFVLSDTTNFSSVISCLCPKFLYISILQQVQ